MNKPTTEELISIMRAEYCTQLDASIADRLESLQAEALEMNKLAAEDNEAYRELKGELFKIQTKADRYELALRLIRDSHIGYALEIAHQTLKEK